MFKKIMINHIPFLLYLSYGNFEGDNKMLEIQKYKQPLFVFMLLKIRDSLIKVDEINKTKIKDYLVNFNEKGFRNFFEEIENEDEKMSKSKLKQDQEPLVTFKI